MNHKTRRIIEQLACERRYGIADAKGAEYSGAGSTYKETGADTLRNFKAVAERTGVTPEQALMTYLLKHIDSITTAVREAAACKKDEKGYYYTEWNPRYVYAQGEGIVSRLDDARNYLDLLECLLCELSHIGEPDGYWEKLEDQAAPGYDMIDGPDVTGCDGCDDDACGFTACREAKMDAQITDEDIEDANEWIKTNVPLDTSMYKPEHTPPVVPFIVDPSLFGDPQDKSEPEIERLRRQNADPRPTYDPELHGTDTPDMIRGYDGILRPRSMPVDTPIIPPICWGETGELGKDDNEPPPMSYSDTRQ